MKIEKKILPQLLGIMLLLTSCSAPVAEDANSSTSSQKQEISCDTGDALAQAVKSAAGKNNLDILFALADSSNADAFAKENLKIVLQEVSKAEDVMKVDYKPGKNDPDDGDIFVVFNKARPIAGVGNVDVEGPMLNIPAKKIDGKFRLHAGHSFGVAFSEDD
ncbi:MAG: hypothetical protein K2X27_21825 [Candidatus Obscuribacterales bacterium]|nr:hypothetical protein [Candidatus Obscuribacterales bacterium]